MGVVWFNTDCCGEQWSDSGWDGYNSEYEEKKICLECFKKHNGVDLDEEKHLVERDHDFEDAIIKEEFCPVKSKEDKLQKDPEYKEYLRLKKKFKC